MALKVVLDTTLDNSTTVESPHVGPVGDATNISYASGIEGKGVRMIRRETYVSYPSSVINQTAGEIEFHYKPTYDFPLLMTNTDKYTLICVSDVTGTDTRLELAVSQDGITFNIGSLSVSSGQAGFTWNRNTWNKIRVAWNSQSDDSLAIYVNDLRVSGTISAGWSTILSSPDLRLFVGCCGNYGKSLAEGTIDNLRISEETPAEQPDPEPLELSRPKHWLSTNCGALADYVSEYPFRNFFKSSRRWFSGSSTVWQNSTPLALDADGWVTSLEVGQYARALILWADRYRFPMPDSTFNVKWEGSGTVAFIGVNTANIQRISANEVVLTNVTGPFGIELRSVATNDYVRNISVMAASDTGTGVFNDKFLDSIKDYGIVRVMYWMHAADSVGIRAETPDDIPSHTDAQLTIAGPPPEYIAELADKIDIEPWICIPHLASDSYVRSYAERLNASIAPNRRVWLEYSNEVWNGQYPQHQYIREQGALEFPTISDPWRRGLLWYGKRSREIFAIFREVMGERVVRVLAGQAVNAWNVQQALGTGEDCDAVAIAPYFYVPPGATTVDAIFEGLDASVQQSLTWITQHRQMIDRVNPEIKLVAYEGGQHFTPTGSAEQQAIIGEVYMAANRDPRMQAVYEQYINGWRTMGGEEFCHYYHTGVWSPWGYWGAQTHYDDVDSPKRLALVKILATEG